MKCPNCQGEWTPPKNVSLSKCPFCQTDILQALNKQATTLTPELILSNTLQVYGTELLQDERRLAAMIGDLFAHDKKTAKMLILSVKEQVPLKILAANADINNQTLNLNAIKQHLKEDAFLHQEAAEKIVIYWTEALEITEQTTKVPIIQEPANTVTDIDGNVYHTIKIGSQTWMVENLKTTRYNDGTPIPNITDNDEWKHLSTGAYCLYNNDISNKDTYGALYNWFAVDTKKLAPKGWHIPTDEEWTELENYLIANGYNYDGTTEGNKIAKSLAAQSGWVDSENEGAIGNDLATNNSSYFTALPGGYRIYNGKFGTIEYFGTWWSSTEHFTSSAWTRYLNYDLYSLFSYYDTKSDGYSVRCIRDF